MIVLEVLLVFLAVVAGFWAIYLMLLPLLAVLVPTRIDETARVPVAELPSVAVIIPAHDMEQVVGRCLNSLKVCRYPDGKLELYVVADHCSDDTAECARSGGAIVLVRNDEPRGKTFTLAWALDALAKRGANPDLYVIVDATVRVAPEFLVNLASHALQGEDIVVGHAVVDPENQQWFAQCVGLSLAHRNLQNWSRERLRLSALIEGRGMAYSRRYIKRYGWSLALPEKVLSESHPTEDWRHGVRVVEHGYRVAFADDARLFTPLRASLGAATQQGIRWERGRAANAVTFGLNLLRSGLRQRNRLKALAGLDAVQPPVAILGGFSIGIALLGIIAPVARPVAILAVMPLALVGLYALAVLEQGRREGISPLVLIWAPGYVAWRCIAFIVALSPVLRLIVKNEKRKPR